MCKGRFLKLLACLCAAAVLCACGGAIPLSARAIVKTVYLDEADGRVCAALVVYTCEPSADTADVTGEARIYTGTGESIADALYDAEEKQNKRAFYAQNRQLWLGPGTTQKDITPYLSYFGAQDASQAELSVFLLPLALEQFAACEAGVASAVEIGEELSAAGSRTGNVTRSAFEARYDTSGLFYGYLPVLDFSADAPEAARVSRLLVFAGGRASCALEETQMQLAMLLSGKAKTLTLYFTANGKRLTVKTQPLFVRREVTAGTVALTLCGKTERISQEGRLLRGEAARAAAKAANAFLEQEALALLQRTEQRGNDIFALDWYARNEGTTLLALAFTSSLTAG